MLALTVPNKYYLNSIPNCSNAPPKKENFVGWAVVKFALLENKFFKLISITILSKVLLFYIKLLKLTPFNSNVCRY